MPSAPPNDDAPKKRRRASTQEAAPESVENEPDPRTATPATMTPKARRGLPRTGKYPLRKPWHQAERQRGHLWAKSNDWYGLAIRSYSRWGNQTRAASDAGVDRQTLVNRLKNDPEFREAMETSLEEFKDGYLEALDEFALKGEERWIHDKTTGKLVCLGRYKNVIAMIFRIKQLMPEFRENYKADVQEAGKATVSMFVQYLQQGSSLPEAELDSLPSFDDFCANPAALPSPAAQQTVNVQAMSAEERRSLMAELAAMDSAEEAQ